MEWIIGTVAIAVTAFTATNIDDILILTIFFAQVDHKFRPRHILIGQYLGFGIILLASLPGYFGGLVIDHKWLGLLGLLPITIGLKKLISNQDNAEINVQTCASANQKSLNKAPIISPQTYHVAVVTFANGGDNIGIYIPLFANSNSVSLPIIVITFLLMIAVWCYAAYLISSHPLVTKIITRYSHILVPLVLIALGLYIMYESKTYLLIPLFQ
ncbi:cadmium resistance transporter [Pseudanabaena minima]|uniref:cadmium resistance transporter n=1 Tax=Pseudanabaena minima TaxID=890415 RepID=UPI003DA90363